MRPNLIVAQAPVFKHNTGFWPAPNYSSIELSDTASLCLLYGKRGQATKMELLSNVVFQNHSSCSVAPDAVFELHAVDYLSEQLVAVEFAPAFLRRQRKLKDHGQAGHA